MKTTQIKRGVGALTMIELLVVIAIIGILAALLLPVLGRAKARAGRVQCIGNLHETGIAFQIFAHDHGGKFTTHVSTNDGGSLEFAAADYQIKRPAHFYFSFKHFLPLAGTLGTPKLLVCPADLERWAATNFSQFNNTNLSFAVGLGADPGIPTAILAADRNLPSGHLNTPNTTIGHLYGVGAPWVPRPWWNADLHARNGDILHSDGHAEQSYDTPLPSQTALEEDLAYPDVKSPGADADIPPSFATPPHRRVSA